MIGNSDYENAPFANPVNDARLVGLFYYAGHGGAVNGRDYLIPTDAAIDRDARTA